MSSRLAVVGAGTMGHGIAYAAAPAGCTVTLTDSRAIAEYLHQQLQVPHYEPPRILRDKVQKGELGKKTGKGFYSWSD